MRVLECPLCVCLDKYLGGRLKETCGNFLRRNFSEELRNRFNVAVVLKEAIKNDRR